LNWVQFKAFLGNVDLSILFVLGLFWILRCLFCPKLLFFTARVISENLIFEFSEYVFLGLYLVFLVLLFYTKGNVRLKLILSLVFYSSCERLRELIFTGQSTMVSFWTGVQVDFSRGMDRGDFYNKVLEEWRRSGPSVWTEEEIRQLLEESFPNRSVFDDHDFQEFYGTYFVFLGEVGNGSSWWLPIGFVLFFVGFTLLGWWVDK